jgi:hypothetical protein
MTATDAMLPSVTLVEDPQLLTDVNLQALGVHCVVDPLGGGLGPLGGGLILVWGLVGSGYTIK